VRTIVVYKWARAAASAVVRQGGQVDWGGARLAAGEDDPAALAVAQALATQSGDVAGLTIGDGETAWALARGADAAHAVPALGPLTDNAATAKALASAVRQIAASQAVDVVVIGDATADPGVAAALAAELGWPALLGVTSAAPAGDRVTAARRVGNAIETVSLPTPAVLAVAAVGEEARAPGMMELIKARKKPVAQLTVEAPAEGVSQRATRLPAAAGARLFEGDADTAAQALVAALRGDGLL
jgi:electron transfer flavoprotein beta subunit